MNRLWVRLTLAFILITVIGVGSVILLVDWTAGTEFRQYVVRQGMMAANGPVDELAAYYAQRGSWAGAETILSDYAGRGRGAGMGNGMMRMGGASAFVLADANGQIVYDQGQTNTGGQLTAADRASAAPIQVNGRTVGYLLAVAPGATALQPAAQDFLDRLRTTLFLAGIAAGVVGILLGLVLSRNLAAPLANLAQGARAISRHELGRRVQVQGAEEVRQAALAFNEMADELEASDRSRRNMVADIAHELRTPLTVMQGNLRALLDEVYPLDRAEIATLYDETRLLSRLVDDLRELALADAGQLSLKSQSLPIKPLLSAAAGEFAVPAGEQQVRVEIEAPENIPVVKGDPGRITQVLRNLLANALRHTPAGGSITLNAAAEDRLAAVRVSVSDTGDGIAAEDLPHVFERFYRADRSRASGNGNTGLGLAIARAWVEAMGGQIGVESTAGNGSTFWFTLPTGD
ncbi:MAG: sensor histidine kinase [Rudaea sp.]